MAYAVAFTRPIAVADPEVYFNDCCYGGDVVSDRLLPKIRQRYDRIQENQEDWGWFIWFRKGSTSLGVDIFCDDPATGAYRIHLTSSVRRFLLVTSRVDTPELEALKQLVVEEITAWTGRPPTTTWLDPSTM